MADDTYTVERSTVVDAPAERVYAQLVDFHRWPAWSPWEEIDPQMQRSYSGSESGSGAVYTWSGNRKAGAGTMTITDATVPSHVDIDLRFEKPFKAQNDTRFTLTPDASGTRVTWTMNGKKTFATRVMGLFSSMDKMVGPDFEKGLARLKTVAETPGA